jgi:hypothetical protein
MQPQQQATRTIIKYVPYIPETASAPPKSMPMAVGSLQSALPMAAQRHQAAGPSSSTHHARPSAGQSSYLREDTRRTPVEPLYAAPTRGATHHSSYHEEDYGPAEDDDMLQDEPAVDVKPSAAELRAYEQRNQLRRMQTGSHGGAVGRPSYHVRSDHGCIAVHVYSQSACFCCTATGPNVTAQLGPLNTNVACSRPGQDDKARWTGTSPRSRRCGCVSASQLSMAVHASGQSSLPTYH